MFLHEFSAISVNITSMATNGCSRWVIHNAYYELLFKSGIVMPDKTIVAYNNQKAPSSSNAIVPMAISVVGDCMIAISLGFLWVILVLESAITSEVVMSTMFEFSLGNGSVAPFYISCMAMEEPVWLEDAGFFFHPRMVARMSLMMMN